MLVEENFLVLQRGVFLYVKEKKDWMVFSCADRLAHSETKKIPVNSYRRHGYNVLRNVDFYSYFILVYSLKRGFQDVPAPDISTHSQ
jgi:hypothetical protein